ncbi:hypothetical protein CDEST_04206 [Colletotrichum destructivum]|uniref:Uncharacterized protein n=1 Tax=Colletotrichum destructivum TaxID=34406 RepID=A0AAX4I722_9PEZI|nr:hypothetical protein CDEST_04206 [Colletotrichum destructivum]
MHTLYTPPAPSPAPNFQLPAAADVRYNNCRRCKYPLIWDTSVSVLYSTYIILPTPLLITLTINNPETDNITEEGNRFLVTRLLLFSGFLKETFYDTISYENLNQYAQSKFALVIVFPPSPSASPQLVVPDAP